MTDDDKPIFDMSDVQYAKSILHRFCRSRDCFNCEFADVSIHNVCKGNTEVCPIDYIIGVMTGIVEGMKRHEQ